MTLRTEIKDGSHWSPSTGPNGTTPSTWTPPPNSPRPGGRSASMTPYGPRWSPAPHGRAFSSGLDRSVDVPQPPSPYSLDDPLLRIGPKANDLWKPVIAAVDGMACGGAFYLLGEAEFLIASENSTFFDPHTTYGMVSAYESIHMAQRMPYGEIARLALMGTAERLGAPRAYEIGLVSELTAPGAAAEVALRRAAVLAAQPTEAVQGTVRALWAAKEAARSQALAQAPQLIALGNLPPDRQAGLFAARPRHGGQEGGREGGRENGRNGGRDDGPPVR